MKMSDEKLRVLRDEVFGPCTVIGECFSLEELRDDLAEYAGRPGGLSLWFEMRLDDEAYDLFPEGPIRAVRC